MQHLNAEREAGFFVTKVIVPLGLIVFMAATVFWVDPENIGPQLGTSTASVLTLIAFQFSLVRMLPPVSYLTRIDLFVLGAMILVFMTLAEAIYTSRHHQRRTSTRKLPTGHCSSYSWCLRSSFDRILTGL